MIVDKNNKKKYKKNTKIYDIVNFTNTLYK